MSQSKVKKAVDQWVQPAHLRGGSRDVAQLLCTMHLLITYIPSPESVWDCTNGPPGGTTQVSLATAKPIEVKYCCFMLARVAIDLFLVR